MTLINRPSLLVLVRHAESLRNQVKRGKVYFVDDGARRDIKGIPDHKIPLTDIGLEQARQTGLAVRARFGCPDYVYHSGYLRTVQTTEGILAAYPEEERSAIKVRSNIFIRERDPGYTYGMTREEAERQFPFMQEYWQEFGGFMARPIGGESLAQVCERVYLFLNMLFRDRAGQRIFIVTHGGTIRCFRFLLERWDYDQAEHWPPGQSPKNCGLTVYEHDQPAGHLLLREYNTVYWK
jgi:broad specificity phosphatase PhoE